MLPVLFDIVIPAGLGKLALALLLVAIAVLRVFGYLRRARKQGERASVGEAVRDDAWTLVALAVVGAVVWRAGLLDREVRLPLHTYGLLIAGAFLVGIWLAQREARRRGQDPERIADLSFWILVAALVGSRVYFILVNWGDYFGSGRALVSTPFGRIPRLLAVWEGGLVFYGGFLLTFAGFWWYTRRRGWRFADIGDYCAAGGMLGLSVGRWGCFSAG